MRLILSERPDIEEPEVAISYREITEKIKRVSDFVRALDQTILCKKGNVDFEVSVQDIFYVESVDKKTFLYGEKEVFGSPLRLYEMEELLAESGFVRISKSTIINTGKLKGVKTLANSRLEAILSNGERVCVTRKYLKDIKEALQRRNS